MKRGILAFIIAFLVIPLVSASLQINDLNKNQYNIGDTASVSGNIIASSDIEGFIEMSMECEGKKYPLHLPIALGMDAGEELSFPSEIELPEVKFRQSMVGDCNIKIEVKEGNDVVEEGSSNKFEVTKSLRGSFNVEPTLVQIGKEVKLVGTIQLLEGSPVEGAAEIYFNDGEKSYFVKSIEIVNGNIEFSKSIKAIPTGDYHIEVLARDGKGNEQLFQAAKFTLSNKLNLLAEVEHYEYLPGDEVEISVEARNLLYEPVIPAAAYLTMGENEFSGNIDESSVSYSFKLPEDIKTGKHTLAISVNDAIGNKGVVKKDIYVNAVPNMIEMALTRQTMEPSDEISIGVYVYDQAGDLINDNIKMEMLNPEEESVILRETLSGSKFEFEFPEHATPGEWVARASYGGISDEEIIIVREVRNFVAEITGNVVTITNKGNVRNEEPIEMNLEGEEGNFEVSSREKLEPGESMEIDLRKKAPSGIYTLAVLHPDGEKDLKSVVIEGGKALVNIDMIFSLLVITLVGMIVFMVIKIKKQKMTPKMSENQLKHLAKNAKTTHDEKQKEEKEKQDAIDDFKRVTLEEIRKTEEKNKPKRSPYADHGWIRPKIPPKQEKKDSMDGAAGFFNGF